MPKKIALIIPSLQIGGMERVMAELANYFCTLKTFEIFLIMYGKMPYVFYDLDPGVKIYQPDNEFVDSRRLFETIKRLLYLRRIIKKIDPDTILSFGTLWNRFVLLSLYGEKYPVYISDRGKPDLKLSIFQELLAKFLYPKAKGIIAQTKLAQDIYFKKKLHRNIKVIGNPVRIIQEGTNLNKENIILTVGRLITTKHHDHLIQIFSKLNASNWKLVLVGGNSLKQNTLERLHQLVIDLNLSDRVVFTGDQNNVDIFYLKSKIFSFTSSSEGFPNVVGEALSAGLPVVSYDCIPGPSEMIADGENGFLVPVFDDDLFQKKLQLLIDNPKLLVQMSENAKKSVSNFSIEQIGQKYYSFITSYG